MTEEEKCEDCSDMIDLGGAYVALEDDEGEFFLHLQCFIDGDWMRDDDIMGHGIADSFLNMN